MKINAGFIQWLPGSSALLRSVCLFVFTVTALSASAQNDSDSIQTFDLRIRDHLFIPAQLAVPANKRFRLRIINEDKTPEEFESAALNREKVVMGESEAFLFIGPLDPGEYDFFGEFNPRTAKGSLLAGKP